MQKNYSIGLDIGTSSVGWAVIDSDNYEVLKGNVKRYEHNLITGEGRIKSKKKALWGVRLFEEAQPAVSRRNSRNMRRRYARRRKRIKLLQDIFRNEINRVDDQFFEKLQTSFLNPEDANNKKIELTEFDKLNIFSNNKRNGISKKYPTIYHLRNDLVNNSKQKDIRLVYLALHHIIKYRGNFLYDVDNFEVDNINVGCKLKESFELIDDKELFGLNTNVDYKNLENIILGKSKNDVSINLKKELRNIIDDPKIADEMVKLIVGNKFNILTIFGLEKEDECIEKISFNGNEYDDNYNKLLNQLNDKIEILEELKELYDAIFIKRMFNSETSVTISELMVEKYDKHKKDLKELKLLLKENKEEYKRIFKSNGNCKCIYEKYIDNNIEYADLKNELGKSFEKIKNIDLVNKIMKELNDESYLPRITSTDNGKYPYQFNKAELRKIIANQGKYYPFLKDEINDVNKIEKILSFKIPYYVGPLNDLTKDKNVKNPNAWLVKKDEMKTEPISIFNFDEVVDKEKTAEKFIERMLGHCTYINNEKAMPINSIFYSRYKVISEIKQISVKTSTQAIRFNKEQIRRIYTDLFLKREKVTRKDLENYLRQDLFFKNIGDFETSGYQGKDRFVSNMKSYIDFFGANGIFNNTSYSEDVADEIIKDITVFEDKDLLKSRIERNYPELDSSKICKLKYSGWSSLSKKLLDGIYYVNPETRERKNIMDLLLETDENFMQIINNKKYDFQKEIDKLNIINKNNKISYELVKDLATSPKNKRGIYQALKVVEEIVNFMEYEPKSISIEMARGEEAKKRTSSRKEYLKNIYNDIKGQIDDYKSLNKELSSKDDNEFTEKVFLYFIQLGRSLYSREKLYLTNLNDYEVDHILPRTLIKDDSLDNKALILRGENASKRDSLVLPSAYRTPENIRWWAFLKKSGLISAKKEFALTRKEYTPEQIEGFINRQLVETRQITKHVANILNNFYKKTKIIYLHANLSYNYREKFKLYKYRELNDYHHAHDAYLAACLGIYQDKYINKNIDFTELKEISKRLYETNNFKELNYGYIINSLDNSNIIFNNKTGEVFNNISFNKTIENTLYRNDIIVSRKTEIKMGEFYKQTIYDHKNKNAHYKIKDNLPVELYGGYDQLKYSYMVLVKYNEKMKLLGIPVQLCVKNDKDNLIANYIKTGLGINDYAIIKNNIPLDHLMIYKNQMIEITGCGLKGAEVVNATELQFSRTDQKKYKYLLNFIFNNHYPVYDKELDISYDEFKLKCEEQFDILINDLFNDVLKKIDKHYFLYNNVYNNLLIVKNSNEFKELQFKYDETMKTKQISKVQVIKELMILLKCSSDNANLKLLSKSVNFSDRVGRKPNVNIDHGILITQSVTGLKENTYEF